MRIFLVISFLFCAQLSFAQFQELFNQSIETAQATQVETDLKGKVTYQEWNGSFLLLETQVTLENCNQNIFRAFVKEGRYIAEIHNDGKTIKLKAHKNLGRMVTTSAHGTTRETVNFRIYFPKGFRDQHGQLLTSTITHEQVDPTKR